MPYKINIERPFYSRMWFIYIERERLPLIYYNCRKKSSSWKLFYIHKYNLRLLISITCEKIKKQNTYIGYNSLIQRGKCLVKDISALIIHRQYIHEARLYPIESLSVDIGNNDPLTHLRKKKSKYNEGKTIGETVQITPRNADN